MRREELAWAAGFFDGEGCFSYTQAGRYGCATIGQTEREPLERFLRAVGVGVVYGPYKRTYPGRLSKKPWYDYRAQTQETVQAVVAMLWFSLGTKKRVQAVRVLRRSATCHRGHRKVVGQQGMWPVHDRLLAGKAISQCITQPANRATWRGNA